MGWTILDRSRDFTLRHWIQTRPGAHKDFYSMSTNEHLRAKQPEQEADHTWRLRLTQYTLMAWELNLPSKAMNMLRIGTSGGLL
jgi:outer membrane biogenesis lipoprotein LolB